jgi:hypothetical protein
MLLTLVPANAVFVVETDEPIEAWRTFSGSDMWNHLKTFPDFAEIGTLADGLDQVISENATLFSVFGKRNLLISAHMTAAKNYDYLFVADMQEGAKLEPVKTGILQLLKQGGFKYTSEKDGEEIIHRFFDHRDKSTLNLVFVANRLICSFHAGIIKESLAEYRNPKLKQNVHFKEVLNQTPAGGLCRIFLNYDRLPAYLACYMEHGSIPRELFANMHFTGTSADIQGRLLTMQGLTNIDDSLPGYLQALAVLGNCRNRCT